MWYIPQLLQHRILKTYRFCKSLPRTHLYLFRKKIHWQSIILQTSHQATGMFCRSHEMQQDSTFPHVPMVLFGVMTQINSCRHSLCRELHHLGGCAENMTRDTYLQTCILTPAEKAEQRRHFIWKCLGNSSKPPQLKVLFGESVIQQNLVS